VIVYGVNPVVEVLTADPRAVERVYVAQGARVHDLDRIHELAKRAGVRVEHVPRDRVARLAGGGVHQGVVAQVGEAAYAEPEDLLALARERGEEPLVLALDQVQDPVHLGASLRSAHLLGGHGVLIPKDRAVGLTPAAMKASAGAAARIPLARAVNLGRALEDLKKEGVWVIGADMDGEPCDRADLTGPLCLVVGGEGKGLRPVIKGACDRVVSVPMTGEGVGSLSASSAAAVLLYEVSRQRRATRSGKDRPGENR
jgi:23S rRNA (guanosine2251-2'-O)-methyltransferase